MYRYYYRENTIEEEVSNETEILNNSKAIKWLTRIFQSFKIDRLKEANQNDWQGSSNNNVFFLQTNVSSWTKNFIIWSCTLNMMTHLKHMIQMIRFRVRFRFFCRSFINHYENFYDIVAMIFLLLLNKFIWSSSI